MLVIAKNNKKISTMECGVRVMGSQGGAVAIGLSGRWGSSVVG